MPFPQGHALLIGVGTYQHEPRLECRSPPPTPRPSPLPCVIPRAAVTRQTRLRSCMTPPTATASSPHWTRSRPGPARTTPFFCSSAAMASSARAVTITSAPPEDAKSVIALYLDALTTDLAGLKLVEIDAAVDQPQRELLQIADIYVPSGFVKSTIL